MSDVAAPKSHAFGREITAPGLHASLVSALSDIPRTAKVLDLGCGSGAWAERLAAAGFTDILGIDRFTTPRKTEHLTIEQRDIERDLRLGDAQFGLITLVEVIEHMTSPGALLSQISSLLTDDGVFLLTTPNIQSLIQRLKFAVTGRFTHFDYGSDPTHYQPVLLEAWERMLPGLGLEVERRWTYPDGNRSDGISQVWRLGAAILGPVLKNPLPGEVLCLRLKKRRTQP